MPRQGTFNELEYTQHKFLWRNKKIINISYIDVLFFRIFVYRIWFISIDFFFFIIKIILELLSFKNLGMFSL